MAGVQRSLPLTVRGLPFDQPPALNSSTISGAFLIASETNLGCWAPSNAEQQCTACNQDDSTTSKCTEPVCEIISRCEKWMHHGSNLDRRQSQPLHQRPRNLIHANPTSRDSDLPSKYAQASRHSRILATKNSIVLAERGR